MQMLVLLLSTVALLSIGWAVQWFFSRPTGKIEPGMRLLQLLTFACFGMQAFDLLRDDTPSIVRLELAAALYVGGIILFWWTIRTHRRRPPSLAYSHDAPEHLVERGPYGVIRHPFYAAYMLFWTGGYLATLRWTSLAPALVLLASYELSARQEERKFASSDLAEEYARYTARTGRYIPNPWKLWRARLAREQQHDTASLSS
jgi:protein-S-isoprenylcysteine O-methyltransferase Ste14